MVMARKKEKKEKDIIDQLLDNIGIRERHLSLLLAIIT
jgi:hypothetical protein